MVRSGGSTWCTVAKGRQGQRNCVLAGGDGKKNDVEPFAYISFVLDGIRWLEKTPPSAELDALLPWNPALRKRLEN